ncbi:hypothetical protein [Encephalitozoon cuniculi GB-M1]|uniref:UPF0329 protein ECU08_2070 n=1 Tax=Encephalitozoon cuniculi (strain GB-M1) TaxID=284813 RepID=Y8K7_ENCCU|nr:uncharacterized protein ECU08_2070 [Encephalitozoon cuniculi GB-M1]Q8SUH9.1 RecName: Full=UPF0329 protein ECU08_2070 [Encephalitozoon cuniculi GB-M1]CAD26509.1 hypothetical protein [Encephalitozoon cuniculi GB-M1]
MRILLIYMLGLSGIACASSIKEIVKESREKLEKGLGYKLSSSEIRMLRRLFEKNAGLETRVVIPVILHQSKVVVSPGTRYRDIEEGERKYVEKVIKLLPEVAWRSITHIYALANNDWAVDLMYDVFDKASSWRSDTVALYKGTEKKYGMKFTDLVNGIFEQNNCILKEFGRLLADRVEILIQELPGSLDDVEKKREEEVLRKIKEYGRRLCTKEKQDEIIKAQRIMCNVCEYIWKREEDRKSFIMEVYSTYLKLREMESNVDEIEEPLIYFVDHRGLINACDKYKSMDIMAELILQLFLQGKNIDDKSIKSAVRSVRERKRLEEMREMEERKRREEERAKNEEELLRMVEREKREESKGRGKKKGGKRGAGEAKEESKEEDRKEEEGVEVEEEESAEVPLVETVVGGARRKKKGSREKKMGEEHHYKVHSRVLRWKKDAEKIKRELDKGSEERWKGKSVEEIKEQKKVHDIVEVSELLRDKEKCDRFFVRTGKYMKGGSERWKMVANGILEEGGEKKVGKVEVGLFKGGRGESVVYHLMFRPTETERTGMVGGSSFGEGDDVDEIKKEKSSDMSGFRYPSGVRCEMTSNGNEFRIEYRNRKNTSEVLRTLTILRIPEIL